MDEWKVRDSAFIGKLTAGATHELRNVLAIIGESAGLVEDIIRLKGGDGRIEAKLALIREQITRGQTILSALNRCAHSTDYPVNTVDVRQSLEDMIILSRRFLRQKNIECSLNHADGIVIKTCPVKWNMVHFAALMSIADDVPNGETIRLACSKEGSRSVVIFSLPSGVNAELPALRGLLEEPSFKEVMRLIRAEAEIGRDVRIRTSQIDL